MPTVDARTAAAARHVVGAEPHAVRLPEVHRHVAGGALEAFLEVTWTRASARRG